MSTSGAPAISVKYYGEYKLVTVIDTSKVSTMYLLYMCDYPSHELIDKAFGHIQPKKIIKIPFKSVAVSSVTAVHTLELLSLRNVIRAVGTPLQSQSSPCLYQLGSEGVVAEAFDWGTGSVDNDALTSMGVDATFGSVDEVSRGLFNGVVVPQKWYNSTAMQSAASFLMYISVFFNQEQAASKILKTIRTSYSCSSFEAISHSNVVSPRKILWCDYGGKHTVYANNNKQPNQPQQQQQSYQEDIWDCYTCPGVECSVVKDAGARLLDYNDFGYTTIDVNGKSYLEATEFMEMAILADIWLNSGDSSGKNSDFNETLTDLLGEAKTSASHGLLPLTEVPAVKNKKVFDFNKRGVYAAEQQM